MSNNGIDSKPSKTALFAALYRAIANKEFNNDKFGPDHLAECFLPGLLRFLIKFKLFKEKIKKRSDSIMPGSYEYMIARTAWFDSLFADALKNDFSQIVLLGAGYDTRAQRFAGINNGAKIIELDMPATQNRKIKCLKKAQISIPDQASFVPADFDKESLASILEKAGYDPHEKTLFIWEGVTYYLEPESVDATLEFLAGSSHDESVVAFDYAVSISEETIDNYYGVKEFTRSMNKVHPGEIFKFSIDEENVGSFLEQRGLKLVNHLNAGEIEKEFLFKTDGSLIGRVVGFFCFVSACKSSNNI